MQKLQPPFKEDKQALGNPFDEDSDELHPLPNPFEEDAADCPPQARPEPQFLMQRSRVSLPPSSVENESLLVTAPDSLYESGQNVSEEQRQPVSFLPRILSQSLITKNVNTPTSSPGYSSQQQQPAASLMQACRFLRYPSILF